MADPSVARYFEFFNEIGIIEQLSRAMFEARLPDGLILPQFSVLNHLIRVRDGQTPLALARAFQVPKTSMTHTLAGLEKRGLVVMRANPEDKRSKQVWLTDAGRDCRNNAIASLGADLDGMADAIPVEQVARLTPALAEIRKIMDAMRD